MTTLHLTLKKKWFDMIRTGEKREEYREIKPYWIKRLLVCNLPEERKGENKMVPADIVYDIFVNQHDPKEVLKAYYCKFKKFDRVVFRNGYSVGASVMAFKIIDITIGRGNPSWGYEGIAVSFIIKLGVRLPSPLLVCGNCKDIMDLKAHKKECKCGICGNVIPAN